MAGRHFRKIIIALLAGTAAAGPVLAEPMTGVNKPLNEERLQPGLYPAAPVPKEFGVPVEPGHPLFDIDWSVGLKGAYTQTNQGNSFVKTLTPQFTAVHDGQRADLTIDGNADIAQRSGGNIELAGLRLGISGTAPIDSVTNVTGNAALSLSQELPGLPGSSVDVIRPRG